MPTGRRFYAAEIETYLYGTGAVAERGYDTKARTAPYPLPQTIASTDTLRVSDIGYGKRTYGDGIDAIYPALMQTAFEIDRRVNLSPFVSSSGASWGSVRIFNVDGALDYISATRSCDGRPARVFTGRKVYTSSTGLETDPMYSTVSEVFNGVATSWFMGDDTLEIPLRDATYWLERPYSTNVYGGTGGADGTANLAGLPKPRARGGHASNSAFPIHNISPLLIDPTNRIYQYADSLAGVYNIYERGLQNNITYAGNVSNLYSGSTPAGQFRVDATNGLMQLGSTPAGQITLDINGYFPVAGISTNACTIIKNMLLEDMLLASAFVDSTNFDAAATYINSVSGIGFTCGYWWPSQPITCIDAIDPFLRSFNGKIIVKRNGKLALFVPAVFTASTTTATSLSEAHIVSISPRRLDAILDPPPYRWRVGYNKNFTIQNSDFAGSVTDAARQVASQPYGTAAISNSTNLLAYKRPNDPPVLETALLASNEASGLASILNSCWGTRRRMYDMVVPVDVGINYDLGDIFKLTVPFDNLRYGAPAQIIGEQYRSDSSTITFQVLT